MTVPTYHNYAVDLGDNSCIFVHNCHAEQNAITQASYHGVSIKGATLYCTTSPCSICTKMIINAGIRQVFFSGLYDDRLAQEMASEAGLVLRQSEVKYEQERPSRL